MFTRLHLRLSERALTLVEVVVSAAILALLSVAALQAVALSRTGQRVIDGQTHGLLLAQDLMTAVTQLAYQDPNSPTFGPESNESASNRAAFDDVDDYANWSESPPRTTAGAALSGYDGDWRRTVEVAYVNVGELLPLGEAEAKKMEPEVAAEALGGAAVVGLPLNNGALAQVDTGVKRITVRVWHRGLLVSELVQMRTSAGPPPPAGAALELTPEVLTPGPTGLEAVSLP